MIRIGVQSKNIVTDTDPAAGFSMMKAAGFTCTDFSLNAYLKNTELYSGKRNSFFDQSDTELEHFFAQHKKAATVNGVSFHQMHMPYPICVPYAGTEINQYLMENVVPKSIRICSFLGCRYLVVHGFKLAEILGSEQEEWEETKKFLLSVAPLAEKQGVILCMENLYNSIGGHLVDGPCTDAILTAERIDDLNETVGSEVFGFCFDTGHANLLGINMKEFISTIGGRLKVLHIHDNDGASDLHQIPYTFTKTRENASSTDWDGFINGLKMIHFDGGLSFETAPVLDAFPQQLKPYILKLIAQIGIYFADRIEGGNL